jgi:hypothetical protein
MENDHCRSKSDRERSILRDAPEYCDTNKIRFQKKRPCLKCGEKFLSQGPYNRICEKCSLINEEIALSTYTVSSEPLGEQDSISSYFPDD